MASKSVAARVAARFLEGEDRYAMSNLPPQDTGVEGAIVWISVGVGLRHGPRLKVTVGAKPTRQSGVTITITDPPRVLGTLPPKVKEQAVAFINRNRDVLLQHWRGELMSKEALSLLRPI